ncbi:hypothetical protein PANDA_010564 [Ailuropoda melanoleuca]|uniref:Maestro heat like repeat family member 5 (gene/pseudogene) n=1 Tax=Ailuropoda melanoleuca TaxID=9646 RepID=D2HHH6_AILME|nr:hypothetical protein PANDA_010564 [Ailuropoda melanoleuca]
MPLENVGREQSDSRKPYHGMGAAGSGLSFCHGEGAQAPLWVWGLVQEVMKHLTLVELTDLIWTAIDGLGSTSPFRVQAAANMLLTAIEEHGASLETVANLGRAIHLQLCSIRIPQARENALHAITLLARSHTPELVATFLDFSIPLDSHAFRSWRALGAEQPVSRLVLSMLLAWLQERPLPAGARDGSPQPKDKPCLRSLAAETHTLTPKAPEQQPRAPQSPSPPGAPQTGCCLSTEHSGPRAPTGTEASRLLSGSSAFRGSFVPPGCHSLETSVLTAMNTLHELQFAREFKKAMQDAYPELLLALLTQMHYVLELDLPQEPQPSQEAPEATMPSPRSTSLEALKSLLSTTGHWQDFAHLELQGAWKLFTTIHTYPQGVGLLARAMVQNRCKQIKAVTSQLLPRLQSKEERERKVAILMLTEDTQKALSPCPLQNPGQTLVLEPCSQTQMEALQGEVSRLTACPWDLPQFLYSPALLDVLPRQAALTVLARSLRDPSPDIRVWSLQGLGNILFHPEKAAAFYPWYRHGTCRGLLSFSRNAGLERFSHLTRRCADFASRIHPRGHMNMQDGGEMPRPISTAEHKHSQGLWEKASDGRGATEGPGSREIQQPPAATIYRQTQMALAGWWPVSEEARGAAHAEGQANGGFSKADVRFSLRGAAVLAPADPQGGREGGEGRGSLLCGQLPPFLSGFFQNSEQVVMQVMGTVSDVLHRLGTRGAAAQSLGVAINARSFFDDERDGIRAAAMTLFGDLVTAMAGRELSGLRTQVHQSMVPLLLHLKDCCPAVVMQAKFALYRCAVLLRWRLRHTLFCTLAWEGGLSARHFLWTCLMTHSQEEFSIHLAQALSYLHSRHRHIKTWAALFIGYTICYHPQAVSQMVNSVDTNLLFSSKQPRVRRRPSQPTSGV